MPINEITGQAAPYAANMDHKPSPPLQNFFVIRKGEVSA